MKSHNHPALWSPWLLKALFALLFFSLIFRPSYSIQSCFTNAGWVYVSVMVFACSLCVWSYPKLYLPLNKTLFFVSAFAGLFILSSLANGATFLEERWAQRYECVLLVAFSFQIFRREKDLATFLAFPVSFFILFLCSESTYQYIYTCQPNDPLGPSCYSSHMWHINMLSQALVLTTPFLLLFRKNTVKRYAVLFDVLMVFSWATIILTGCRSSFLALVIFFLLQYVTPFGISRKRTTALLLLSALCFCAIYNYQQKMSSHQNTLTPLSAGKQGSAQYRWEVWKKTVGMSFDFPQGIGVNHFEFGFLPYKRDSQVIENGNWEVDKAPHNEFIRLLVEEGWLTFAAVLIAFFVFIFKAARSVCLNRLEFLPRFILVSLPELFFQFPTEMYLPVFLASCCIGACCEKRAIKKFSFVWKSILVVASAGVMILNSRK